jgi:hypothetical protein
MPTNEHIFELIQSLSKGERHHLRLMAHHFGKKETGFYGLLDELYRIRKFDQDHIMSRLKCKSYIVRRGMLRLFQLSLEARALIAPTEREKLPRSIEDIRYLIHKKAKSAALPLIREALESCQMHEVFDEQLEVASLWSRHYQPNSKDQKTITEAIQEAKSAKANLQEYEALQRRMEHINRREADTRFDMLTEGILKNPLMLSSEKCESSRARYVFHTILGKLNTYLGKYEVAVEHLRRTNFIVASYKHLFRDHEYMLLEGQCILAKVLLAIERIGEAEEILRRVWSSDFKDDYLVAERFKENCSIKLQNAIVSGNEQLGSSAINLIERYLEPYKPELNLTSLEQLLFYAGKFHFYLAEHHHAEKYFTELADLESKQNQDASNTVNYPSFSLLMLLIQAIEAPNDFEVERLTKILRKRVRYKQFQPSYLGRIFLEIIEGASGHDQNEFRRTVSKSLPTIAEMDVRRLGLDHYLQSKVRGVTPMEIVRTNFKRNEVSGYE